MSAIGICTCFSTNVFENYSILTAHYMRCPDGWKKYGGYCYLVQLEELPWIAARDSCVRRGSNLASIADKAEADFLKSFAHSDQVELIK